MFAPTVSDIINYQTISTLGMLDNYLAIILPALGTSLGLYIMKQFMSQIPDALIESAHIDGASTFTVFWKIVMPNVKPAWLTLAIFSFQGLWNNANTTYIYREELKSLPYALNQIVGGGIIPRGGGGGGQCHHPDGAAAAVHLHAEPDYRDHVHLRHEGITRPITVKEHGV